MTWYQYFKSLYTIIITMWPKAREFGLRYYWDQEFRRIVGVRIASRRKRQLYGSGFLVNKQGYKRRLVLRDGLRCSHCPIVVPYNQLTIDHVVPVAKGGKSEMSNLQLLCVPCHIIKDSNDRTLDVEIKRSVNQPFKIAFAKLYERKT